MFKNERFTLAAFTSMIAFVSQGTAQRSESHPAKAAELISGVL
jgi:hypothetical protein